MVIERTEPEIFLESKYGAFYLHFIYFSSSTLDHSLTHLFFYVFFIVVETNL